eukprot:2551720-Rhodomonas_salina.1
MGSRRVSLKSAEFAPGGHVLSPAAQHAGAGRLGSSDVQLNSTLERDGPPPAPPDPELRDVLHQGLPVPMSIFHSGVSPPIDLDLAVAMTDARIPLPGTL